MTHQDYQEMLALHALAALDQRDLRAMQEHLETCAECRADLDGWQDTTGALAYVADPVEPSPQVRDRILETIRAEGSRASEPAYVIQLKPRRSDWFPRFAAIAASLILVTLAALLVFLWQQNRAARIELARLSALNEEIRREGEREQKAVELLSSPGTRLAQLTGTKEAPAARGVLAYDPKSGRAILMTDGLPPAPAGKAYQLWFIVGDLPLPGGVFATDSGGKAMSADQIPGEALPTAVFAVTQEAAGGARTPTGPILLRSST